jgi:hypothetical protein
MAAPLNAAERLIPDLFDEILRHAPDADAIVDGDRQMTFTDWWQRSAVAAGAGHRPDGRHVYPRRLQRSPVRGRFSPVNEKVYIHEFIDITKQNRARYMHHMTANWGPIGQEQRHQLCYGVWGVVGSTGRWPQVVNIWEEDGFAGLAASFRQELSNPKLQDPALEKWAAAADLRSGGLDRILVPHPDTLTIKELCREGVRGEAYAHELIDVAPGTARSLLDVAVENATGDHGWRLAGAWLTSMRDLDECVLLWAIPSWEEWAAVEADESAGRPRLVPKAAPLIRQRQRILLVDSPLSPFRTGRQPSRDDRTDWQD